MKKLLFLGLLLVGLLIVYGCAPPEPKNEEELFLEEVSGESALAGQAVQLRCQTQPVNVYSFLPYPNL